MKDTSPEMDQKFRELLASKTPQERLLMACSMGDSARYLVTHSIRAKNPNISKADLMKELFLIYYGQEFSANEKEKILRSLEEYHTRNSS
ncbi:MAG: hypothetical protein KDK56_10135 [Simkania sp.]|nr:hypothetical protein [Simkania sp.]MCB1075692.1 hypothetical protein [Simkania sp.]MCP5489683.1 hypothetical protein [Chlamydiales bacterium]